MSVSSTCMATNSGKHQCHSVAPAGFLSLHRSDFHKGQGYFGLQDNALKPVQKAGGEEMTRGEVGSVSVWI